jgi:phospholipase/lecithinase/hemolysin
MRTLRFVIGAFLIIFILSAGAFAQSISQVVVLGDSLSDNGNLYQVTSFPPSPFYWLGRASNGPVAVEYLAQRMGVALNDFAWYGATTGVGNVYGGGTVDGFGFLNLPGITTAFQGVLSAGIDPNALYVVWGGPNDFWTVTPGNVSTAISTAVSNLVTIVETLQTNGATQILVPNMPDLGKTPRFLAAGTTASSFATQISLGFNQLLKASLPAGVHYFDTFSFVSNATSNPDRYGLVNITEPCLTTSVCANPDEYFYFDGVHPTTVMHELLGNALYQSAAPTVIIGECNSDVPNELLSTGSTFSDLIIQAGFGAKNHGQFVSGVASITNALKQSGAISESQKGAIQDCAAKGQIP